MRDRKDDQTFVMIETTPGAWTKHDVSFRDRRRLAAACRPEHRFIKPDGSIWLALEGSDDIYAR